MDPVTVRQPPHLLHGGDDRAAPPADLAGAAAELVRSIVRAGRTDELPDLEDTLVSLHLAVLAARPWHSPEEA